MQGPARGPMNMAETRASEGGFPEQGLCSGPRGGCLATVLRATLARSCTAVQACTYSCVFAKGRCGSAILASGPIPASARSSLAPQLPSCLVKWLRVGALAEWLHCSPRL